MQQILNEWKKFLNEQHTKTMMYTKELLNSVAQYEITPGKLPQAPYLDSGGVWTIGYGTTIYPIGPLTGRHVTKNDPPISEEKAKEFLAYSLNESARYVNFYVKKDLNQNQFDALVSFVYNVGVGNFKNSTLLSLININPDNPKIFKEFLKFTKNKKGDIQPGLLSRRQFEANLYSEKIPQQEIYGKSEMPNNSQEQDVEKKSIDNVRLEPSEHLYTAPKEFYDRQRR